MPRIPKPFPYKGWYRTNAGGKRGHPLCRIDEGMTKARRALNLYLGKLADEARNGIGIQPAEPKEILAGDVHDQFLDFKKSESEPLTYRHYVDKLKPFLERFGHQPLQSLTEADGIAYKNWLLHERLWTKGGRQPLDPEKQKKRKKPTKIRGVGPTTCNHFIRAAKTLLNWAAHPKRKLIPHNPWDEIGLLTEKPRERLITPQEFDHLLTESPDDDFRETLQFMRFTTARPGEVRMAEWSMIDWNNHRINLDRRKVKTRNSRSLTLLPELEATLKNRLDRVRQSGGDIRGRIFLNANGDPWESLCFCQKFRRLRNRCVRKKLIEAEKSGEKLVLYSTRHSRAVEMIRDEGIDVSIASKEMGHANISTTVRHYLHLSDQDVTEAIRKARPTPTQALAQAVRE